MSSTISDDIQYIKITIEHIIKGGKYSKNELVDLLTDISKHCDEKIDDMTYEDNDYPFASWFAYSSALLESLKTEYYGITYPKYKIACDDNETDAYCIIVDLVTLHGEDPQNILNDLVEMMCNDGKRYAEKMLNKGRSDIIDYLLLNGAKMNADMVFNWEVLDIKEDIEGNHIRASLIDYYFPKLGITADEYEDIKALGDKEVDYMASKINMDNPYARLDIVKGDLKFKSKFLSGL